MKLSKRLATIVSLLDLPAKIADIGTDHAYLPIHLAKLSSESKIIAIENKEQPYNAAQANIKQAKLSDRIELRLGSGLEPIEKGEINSLIIAGMGAKTIREIISESYQLAQELDKIILQPMAGAGRLRSWLVENNFRIADELLLEEKEIYQILLVEVGQEEIGDDFLLELGPRIVAKAINGQQINLAVKYLTELESKWQRIIAEIIQNKSSKHPKVVKLEKKLNRLESILQEVEDNE